MYNIMLGQLSTEITITVTNICQAQLHFWSEAFKDLLSWQLSNMQSNISHWSHHSVQHPLNLFIVRFLGGRDLASPRSLELWRCRTAVFSYQTRKEPTILQRLAMRFPIQQHLGDVNPPVVFWASLPNPPVPLYLVAATNFHALEQ